MQSGQLTWSARWQPPEFIASVAAGEAAAATYPGRSCVSRVRSGVPAAGSTVRDPDLEGRHRIDASLGEPGSGMYSLAV